MSTSNKIIYLLGSLVVLVVLLSLIGLIMLYSTTASMYGEGKVKHQFIWIVLGAVAALVLQWVDYRNVGRVSLVLLILITLPLFYLAFMHIMSYFGVPGEFLEHFPFVESRKGTYRWLKLGHYTLQPSEFAKLAIIIFVANYYGRNPRYVYDFRAGIVIPALIVGSIVVAILLGGSFSVTCITSGIVVSMLFIAGIRLRYFIVLLFVGIISASVVLYISPERFSRITSFRNPEKYKYGSGYQLYSSQLALGSGYWFGIGFAKSRIKEYYLPEAHTDFIIAIIGEELGFITIIMLLLMYITLIKIIFSLSMLAIDREGMLLGTGIGMMIGLQILTNIAVVSGFAPTTGVTAPFVSYGGSSMLAIWMGIGFIGSIGRNILQEENQREKRKTVLF